MLDIRRPGVSCRGGCPRPSSVFPVLGLTGGALWSVVGAALMVPVASTLALAQAGPAATDRAKAPAVDRAATRAAATERAATKAAGTLSTYSCRVTEKGTGKPVVGATVMLTRFVFPDPATGDQRILQKTTHPTDADGRFRFTITPEQMAEPVLAVALRVEHPDYPPEDHYEYDFPRIRRHSGPGGSPPIAVEMSPGRPITGVVVTPDGRPASGVAVEASSFSSPESSAGDLVMTSRAATRTDGGGRFRLVVVTPGEVYLTLSPDRFAASVRKLDEGRRGDLGRFVLREGIVLKGKVVDAEGRPMAGVFVNAAGFAKEPAKDEILDEAAWGDQLGSLSQSAVTDARGEFATAPLPSGVYRILPVDRDRDALDGGTYRPLPAPFTWKRVTLKDGDTPPPVEIRAMPSVIVAARIRDNAGLPEKGGPFFLVGFLDPEGNGKSRGGPLEIPAVGKDTGRSWTGRARPGADGRIVVRVPRGLRSALLPLSDWSDVDHAPRYRIGGGGSWRRGPGVWLESVDRDIKDIEVVVYRSPTIFVRVVARDGSKIQRAQVTAGYADVGGPGADPTGLTDGPLEGAFREETDGRFRSLRLLPDEGVTVTASADGYRPRSETLKLAEGASKDLELVLDRR